MLQTVLSNLFIHPFYQPFTANCSINTIYSSVLSSLCCKLFYYSVHSSVPSILCLKLFYKICFFVCFINSLLQSVLLICSFICSKNSFLHTVLSNLFIHLFHQSFAANFSIKSVNYSSLSILYCKLIYRIYSFICSIHSLLQLFYRICSFICSINFLLLTVQSNLFIHLFYQSCAENCSIKSVPYCELFYQICSFVCSINSLLQSFFVKSVLFLLSSRNTLPLAASLAYYAYPISVPIFFALHVI